MMLSTLKLRITQHKSLVIAALVSLALHTLLLSNYSISLPSDIEHISTINARIINALPEKKLSKQAVKKAEPTPLKKPPPKPRHQDTATTNPDKPAPSLEDSSSNQLVPDQAINTETTNTSNSEDALIEDVPDKISVTDNISNTLTTTPYTYIETEFEVTRGDDSGVLGTTQITFNMDRKNNTYQLTSITEAKGLASLFLGKLEQRSEGSVHEQGLKPNYYAYQYAKNSDKNQFAHLSWSNNLIEMTSKKGKKSESLPEGTQDFLSFMYQFMFTPPLSSMQITMTNGKYLRIYTYSFEGEESIPTKLGHLNTLHLLKSGDDQEKTEIWLALDYQNIPVRIRKTEKDGSVIEQTATKIMTTAH